MSDRLVNPVRRTLRAGEIASTTVTCEHAVECAGCPLIQLDYATQVQQKRARVVNAVMHYPALELLFTRPVTPAEPAVGYRGRAKLIVSPKGGIGLYSRAGNHEVVDIPGCRVVAPALSTVVNKLRALIPHPPEGTRAVLLPYDPLAGGVLRAIDLREVVLPETSPHLSALSAEAREESRSAVLLTLVLQRDRAPTRAEIAEAARALMPLLPRVIGIAANFHEADAPQILGPETSLLAGVAQAEDRIGQVYHLASYGSFVQAHRGQTARIHQLIAKEIGALDLDGPVDLARVDPAPAPPRVLDLYGGSGAISLALAHAKCAVTMVESFVPATENARAAAAAQGLTTLEVRSGDVADVAAQLVAQKERFDAIVVNPPRRGVSPAAREAVTRLGAPMVVYVSCDPDTLARDLDHFARLGYATGELIPFDMIPLTEEVETVTVLRRSPPPIPKVLYEDEEIIVVDKGPHEPVDPHPEFTSSLVQRCARLPGALELSPIHRLEGGTSGLVMMCKDESARAGWTNALTQGRLVYLAAAKGVTPAKGAITRDLREGGRAYPARTRYRRLAIASGHSILRVIPDGGRPHQIRRHLAAIGHPVLGDERYGHLPTNRYFEEKHGLDRSFLHLVRIEVTHPKTGAKLLIESALPGDLRASLERATGSSVLRFLENKHALGSDRTSSLPPPPGEGMDAIPPSFRGIDLTGEDGERISVPPPSTSFGPESEGRGVVPDFDESPRTLRRPIVSSDED